MSLLALAPVGALQLVPASRFTIQQLTDAYNQTRVDYLVPMPMNAARLTEYIEMYDIDLDHSFVAVEEDQIQGLGMLGVRPDRAWITRLGVLPTSRRHGLGMAFMQALLGAAAELNLGLTILEVILHNTPAHKLFLKCGFREVNELLILRRPPTRPAAPINGQAQWLTQSETLKLLQGRSGSIPWTNQTESFANAAEVLGVSVTTAAGGQGWAAFLRQRFVMTHLVLQTDQGPPADVGHALLAQIHNRYPTLDTQAENIATTDPHLPAFYEAGYVESFRRVQMYRED
jgi:GNAT superfamily N-acetyltransferase